MISLLLSFIFLFIAMLLFLKEESIAAVISVSILLFLGLLGLIPFIFRESFMVSYQNSSFEMFIFSLILFLVLIFYKRRYFFRILKERIKSTHFSFLTLLITIFLSLILLKGYYMSVRGWDSYALYDARAKFFLQGIRINELSRFSLYDIVSANYYLSYPPMTSVIHAALYSSNFASPMITYGLFYSAIFLVLFDYFRKSNIKTIYKLIFFIAIVFNSQIFGHIGIAYSNLPMLAFQLAGLVFLLRFIDTGKAKYIFLSGILVAYSGWTRYSEPTHLAFILAGGYYLFINKKMKFNKKISLLIFYSLLIYLTRWLWVIYRNSIVNQQNISNVGQSFTYLLSAVADLGNVASVLGFVSQSLKSLFYYFLIPTILFAALIINKGIKAIPLKGKVVLVFILGVLAIFVAGTFVFSATRPFWREIAGSLTRATLLLLPSLMIFSTSLLEAIKSKNAK